MQRVLKIALLQTKLLREPLAGFMHLAIFWGFVALIVAVVESIGEGITGHFSFRFLGDSVFVHHVYAGNLLHSCRCIGSACSLAKVHRASEAASGRRTRKR